MSPGFLYSKRNGLWPRLIFCDWRGRKGHREKVKVIRTGYSDESRVLRRIMLDVPVPGKRRRGRHKSKRKDSCKTHTGSVGIKVEEVLDRTQWHNDIQYHSGDPR